MKVARERAWAKKCLENARSVLETANDEAVHAQVSAIALAANAYTERLRGRRDAIGVWATWVLIASLAPSEQRCRLAASQYSETADVRRCLDKYTHCWSIMWIYMCAGILTRITYCLA